MSLSRRIPASCALAFVTLLGLPLTMFAQDATVAGRVADPTGAVIVGAHVVATRAETGTNAVTVTNGDGWFLLPTLQPGHYRLSVSKDGFKSVTKIDLELHVQDIVTQNFTLPPGAVTDSVTVSGASLGVETNGVSTVVDHTFVENTALNGRSFQPLLLLMPGAVIDNSTGYISIDGMRSDTNYFTVDGVGANVGVNNVNSAGVAIGDLQSISGTAPSLNAFGGTQAMLGLDSMEEFKVQASSISARFGRQMGSQVQLTSRSGTNAWHGSLFDYLRNDALDAQPTYPLSPTTQHVKERQNDFGGTVDGPVVIPGLYNGRNKTFYFFSYEGQKNILPNASNVYDVPSVALRDGDSGLLNEWLATGYPTVANSSSIMPADVTGLLKTYPLPNVPCTSPSNGFAPNPSNPQECLETFTYFDSAGAAHTFTARTGTSTWQGVISNRRSMGNWSLKLDHVISSKLNTFFRYSDTSSYGTSLGFGGPTNGQAFDNWTKTATLGLNWLPTNILSNTLRINFSTASGGAAYGAPYIHDGGIAPGPNDIIDGLKTNSTFGTATLSNQPPYSSYYVGSNRNATNRQWNVVDDITWVRGKHTFGAGFDWRHLFPNVTAFTLSSLLLANSVPDLYSGTATAINRTATSGGTIVTDNYSTYFQDAWRVTPSFTLDLGLRWEINPPPHATNPADLRFVTGWTDSSTMTLAPAGTAYYDTPWRAFAPRLGFSYQLPNGSNGWETTLRAGWGMFYDLAGAFALNAFSAFPFAVQNVLVPYGPTIPLGTLDQVLATRPPPVVLTPPYPTFQTFIGHMDKLDGLPKSYQWNLTIEQRMGTSQIVSAAYVGNIGRSLQRQISVATDSQNGQLLQLYPSVNFPQDFVSVNRNDPGYGDRSDYHALQVQYRRGMSKGLEALANYTWSHAIDTGSTSLTGNIEESSRLPVNDYRGNSDFDRRHVFNAVMTYQPPKVAGLGAAPLANVVKAIANNWMFTSNFKAQTGTPLTIQLFRSLAPYLNNYTIPARFDLVPGQPLWIHDDTVAAGRYLNPAAFAIPASCLMLNPLACQNGTSGRNGIGGFSFWQEDFSVNRLFLIHEKVKMEFRADFFNLLNHPNWANPNTSAEAFVFNNYDPVTLQSTGVVKFNLLSKASLSTPGMQANNVGGGLTSLYQQGGPRSIQLALRLTF